MKTSTKNTLIRASITLVVGILGIIGGSQLNIDHKITIKKEGEIETVDSNDYKDLEKENIKLQRRVEELSEKIEILTQETMQSEVETMQSNFSENKNSNNYLLNLVKPYESSYWFKEYNGQTFDMGGDSYTHGFTCMGYGSENEGNVIVFNLHQKYNRMSFIVGVVHRAGIFSDEDNDCVIRFYTDDKLADTVVVNPDNLPSEHEVNINNCQQLKICVYDGKYVADGSGTYGFAEVKIFE